MMYDFKVFETDGKWRIEGLQKGQSVGIIVGEDRFADNDAFCLEGDWAFVIAAVVASKSPGATGSGGGCHWESEIGAETAADQIRVEMVNQSSRKWTLWQRIAVAEGWKPPKGWRNRP